MKAIFNISVCITAAISVVAAAAWTLAHFATAIHFHSSDCLIAALMGMAASSLAILPLVMAKKSDISAAIQMAMLGTVIHLISAGALAAGAIALHLISTQLSSLLWLFIGYWVSLIVLIFQLRHMILHTINTAKLQKQ